MTIKILNLYAGIGGNRKLWKGDIKVTSVEIDPEIAQIYKDNFPNDEVIVGDAHKYLIEHFKEFDFIWSSPPCPTHSKLRRMLKEIVYPDMKLYEEIILLRSWFKGKWVIENVVPYYPVLITPKILHRHCFWSNFDIKDKDFPKMETCKIKNERIFLSEKLGYNLDKYSKKLNKRQILRNCVLPELGEHVFACTNLK